MKKREAKLKVLLYVRSMHIRPQIMIIVLLCLALLLMSIIFFFPGFMTFDSIFQILQAKHYFVISDWHPPVLTLLWRAGIRLTSTDGSMLILQQAALWLGITALCLYIYKRTRSLLISLLPIVVTLLPFIFILTGTIWKDVQLMIALLLSVVAILYMQRAVSNRLRNGLFVAIIMLLTYGLLVRHGAWLAVLPIAFAAGYIRFKSIVVAIVTVIGVFIISEFTSVALESIFNVEKNNLQATVMIDDIIAVRTDAEIRSSGMNTETKEYLILLRHSCDEGYPEINRSLTCGHPEPLSGIIKADHESIKDYWVSSVVSRPSEYLGFRATIFGRFINPNGLTTGLNISQMRNEMSNAAIPIQPPKQKAANIAYAYQRSAMTDFGFAYKPYFWILVCGGLATVVAIKWKKTRNKLLIFVVMSSGLGYVFSFFFFAVSYDYRYSYWFVVATLLAGLLIYLESLPHTTRMKPNTPKIKSIRGKKTNV